MEDRPLPKDLDAERIVLGSSLVDKQCLDLARQRFEPIDFYSIKHQKLFEALLKWPDIPMDYSRLGDMVGDPDAALLIAELCETLSTVENLPYHINKLKDCSARRDSILRSQQDIARAYNPEIPFVSISLMPEPYHTSSGKENIQPPDHILIENIMRDKSMGLIGAGSKSYKTWLGGNLAVSFAHGLQFLGNECAKKKVLVANFELKDSGIQHRFSAIAAARGVPFESENLDIWNLRGCNINIEDFSEQLIALVKKNKYEVVLIDPLYRVMVSRVKLQLNENAAIDMPYILSFFDRIVKETGISLFVVHHFTKGLQGYKSSIDRFSGSGGFARFFDVLMTISELEEEDCYRLEVTTREFARPEPLSIRWEYPIHHLDAMLDGTQLKGGTHRPVSAGDRKAGAQADEDTLQRIIYKKPGESKRTITSLAHGEGVARERARSS